MTSSYRILFTIELQHEYFADEQCPDFDIIPTNECLKYFKGFNILWRNLGNRFIAIIKEDEKHHPFIPIPADVVFQFYIVLKNPLFFNYTNINKPSGSRQIFYFSNRADNTVNGVHYLTIPVSKFTNGKGYLPGDLVAQSGTANIFEALKKHTSTNITELNNSSLWAPKGLKHLLKPLQPFVAGHNYESGDYVLQPVTNQVFEALVLHTSTTVAELSDPVLWAARGEGQLQYPTTNDFIVYSNGHYTFALNTPATHAAITINGFNNNAATPAYDVPVVTYTQDYPALQNEVDVNVPLLKQGKYVIDINGEAKAVYVDSQLRPGAVFGVIELLNYLPNGDEYGLFLNDGTIKQTSYRIHFPSRKVLWKYVRKDNKAQTIVDSSSHHYVFSLHGNSFVSALPIPLSQQVLDTLELDFNTPDAVLFPLPNPPVHQLSTFTQNGYDYLCAEWHLNY